MYGPENRNDDHEIVVDPNRIELDAEWRAVSRWMQFIAWALARCRNQAALVASTAVIATVYVSGASAEDTPMIVVAALLSIVVVTVATEWITARYDGSRNKNTAASCDA